MRNCENICTCQSAARHSSLSLISSSLKLRETVSLQASTGSVAIVEAIYLYILYSFVYVVLTLKHARNSGNFTACSPVKLLIAAGVTLLTAGDVKLLREAGTKLLTAVGVVAGTSSVPDVTSFTAHSAITATHSSLEIMLSSFTNWMSLQGG